MRSNGKSSRNKDNTGGTSNGPRQPRRMQYGGRNAMQNRTPQNRSAVSRFGVGRVTVGNIHQMYPAVSLLARATLLDCPALGHNPEMVESVVNSCPNTGAIHTMKEHYGPGVIDPRGWAEWCCFLASLTPGASGRCCEKVPESTK